MSNLIGNNAAKATVLSVTWERIFLILDVEVKLPGGVNRPLDFYAVNEKYEARVHFEADKKEDGAYRLKTNVTNGGDNCCIPGGTYRIFVCQGDDKLAECETAQSIVPFMDDYSRNFLYGNRGKAYTITFFIEEGGETLPFRFHTLSSSRNVMVFPENPKYRNTWHLLRNFKNCFLTHKVVLRRLYRLFARMRRNRSQKTILFMTEQSSEIKSNLKAVSDRMYARGLNQQYRLLFSARTAASDPQTKKSWIQLVKKMAASDIIFIDDHAPVLDWLKLKKDTMVVQLWHAGAGFKSSGYSRWGHDGCPGPVSCHRQYHYGIAGSQNIAPFFSEVWGINDELVLPTGMPRMDEYLDETYKKEKREELYKLYPQCKGKKVILFAPTYRGRNKKTAFYPYEVLDLERLYQQCEEEYVVLFKMHPWVNQDIYIQEKYRDRYLDVKNYPNINDIFYITDLLITDYSSNIFEYSLMHKPMLFYAFDEIQYSFSRGFHRNYSESAPGKVCHTFDELMLALSEQDFEFEKVEAYVEHHFDFTDSHASDRVIDWIVLGRLPEAIRNKIKAREEDLAHMYSLQFAPENEGTSDESTESVENTLLEDQESSQNKEYEA